MGFSWLLDDIKILHSWSWELALKTKFLEFYLRLAFGILWLLSYSQGQIYTPLKRGELQSMWNCFLLKSVEAYYPELTFEILLFTLFCWKMKPLFLWGWYISQGFGWGECVYQTDESCFSCPSFWQKLLRCGVPSPNHFIFVIKPPVEEGFGYFESLAKRLLFGVSRWFLLCFCFKNKVKYSQGGDYWVRRNISLNWKRCLCMGKTDASARLLCRPLYLPHVA